MRMVFILLMKIPPLLHKTQELAGKFKREFWSLSPYYIAQNVRQFVSKDLSEQSSLQKVRENSCPDLAQWDVFLSSRLKQVGPVLK
ncbi:hypothetical protein AVEN_132288-1 [Araneus ventricosus]|uniref:Uncharacterized protein n=1 Tax=Araneus ventricosus TaxID=182803 RepID=A0A4Y2SH53_ARAVE|nr:hypothetical protein AVEN_132288-1 [Araneus ventricosus]